MQRRNKISQTQLRKVLRYDPKTGVWTWAVQRMLRAGSPAGTNVNGYVRIGVYGRYYYAHVLAWFYMTGEWPRKEVDHRNTLKSDNRWKNLRLATHSQNRMNCRIYRCNSSGFKGVYWHKKKQAFIAYIRKDNVQYHLGTYPSADVAAAVRRAKARELFGDFERAA